MYSYIHIPFCNRKCSYCRFASLGATQELQVETYVQFLCKEIEASQVLGEPLQSLYFGGGTPSTLSIIQLKKIIGVMQEKYVFLKNIEITLETTPQNIIEKNIQAWKELGINRLSIGVQTLNEKSLQEIGRGNKGDITDALDIIQKEGFENVSLDFILGLPYVKKGETQKDIAYILDRYDFIKHISVYMLEEYYEPDKIIETRYDIITYPDDWGKLGLQENEFLGEYIEVKNFLEEKGFQRYEISNYAKTGYECKHNKAYWNHSEVIAFGLGAYSYIDDTRIRNSDNFIKYYAGKGNIEEKNTLEGIFLEKIMFQLRTGGIEMKLVGKLNLKKIEELEREGYLKYEENKLCLEDKGALVMDYILQEII